MKFMTRLTRSFNFSRYLFTFAHIFRLIIVIHKQAILNVMRYSDHGTYNKSIYILNDTTFVTLALGCLIMRLHSGCIKRCIEISVGPKILVLLLWGRRNGRAKTIVIYNKFDLKKKLTNGQHFSKNDFISVKPQGKLQSYEAK